VLYKDTNAALHIQVTLVGTKIDVALMIIKACIKAGREDEDRCTLMKNGANIDAKGASGERAACDEDRVQKWTATLHHLSRIGDEGMKPVLVLAAVLALRLIYAQITLFVNCLRRGLSRTVPKSSTPGTIPKMDAEDQQ